MICQNNQTSLLAAFTIALTALLGSNTAYAQNAVFQVPRDAALHGGIYPVTVTLNGFDADPIVGFELSVDNNPEPYRKAISGSLTKPLSFLIISTRVRIGSLGVTPISIRAKLRSGKVFTNTAMSGSVTTAADFSDPNSDSMSPEFKGSFRFPTNEIGQPQLSVQRVKDDQDMVVIKGMLHHPMSPPSGKVKGMFVRSVDIEVGGTTLVNLSVTPGLTNDPFIGIQVRDPNVAGAVRMVWRDSKDAVFSKQVDIAAPTAGSSQPQSTGSFAH